MFAVIGSTTVDVTVESPGGLPGVDGDEFTSTSLVLTDEPLRFSMGGNGANCAYVLAGLGAETVLCSALGGDELGEMMVGWLEEAGVGLSALKQMPSEATSSTTIIHAGANRFSFHHPGALATYEPADLPGHLPASADVLLVCAYPLLRAWRPNGYADMIKRARDAGVITALDVGPTVGEPVTLGELRPFLKCVDYYICNSLELETCAETDDLVEGMRRVSESGASCVVTKLGPRGAAVLESGRRDPEIVPGFSVEARGTVGAGDSFNAGFLFARRQGRSVVEAARFGNALAAIVIASPRGVMALPDVEDVERRLRG